MDVGESHHDPAQQDPLRLRLRGRIGEVRALLRDIDARHDAAALIAELENLAALARGRSDLRLELRQLLILMGMVECKRGDSTRARSLLIDGLAMDAGPSADRTEVALDHYFLASVASDLKSFQTAAEHYGKAVEYAAVAGNFDVTRQLGIRERHAFALHEAGRFRDACEANQRLLEDAETLLGADDHRLGTVVHNLAQNLYALKRLPEAQSHLERALGMAHARGEIEREQDLLYQLAVLAGEQGKLEAARAYLAERVARLAGQGPSRLQEAARRSLEHFDRHRAPQA